MRVWHGPPSMTNGHRLLSAVPVTSCAIAYEEVSILLGIGIDAQHHIHLDSTIERCIKFRICLIGRWQPVVTVEAPTKLISVCRTMPA